MPTESETPGRRVLFLNLDFRDFIYSWFFGRRVLQGCRQRGLVVDAVEADPFANRDLPGELGVPRAALETASREITRLFTERELSRIGAYLDELLARHRYDTVILNTDAPVFIDLLRRHDAELRGARWLIYDRHLHEGLRGPPDPDLRSRVEAHRMNVFTPREIAKGAEIVAPGAPQSDVYLALLGAGFRGSSIHLPRWPLDDDFFAPRPSDTADAFTIFSGGDSGRDYESLFEAVRGLPVRVRLATGSPPGTVPENVTILPRLLFHEFRDEVARASAIVVPLTGHPPVSGITVVSMARMMGKPLIATDTFMVREHVRRNGLGGYLVRRGDRPGLRAAIERLQRDPAECLRVGAEAREEAKDACSLKRMVDEMLSCDDVPRAQDSAGSRVVG